MIQRIYKMEDLTEAAEMLRKGPPWWLHAALFGIIVTILVAFATLVETGTKAIRRQLNQDRFRPSPNLSRDLPVRSSAYAPGASKIISPRAPIIRIG